MCYIGVTEGKIEKGKMRLTQNLKTLALIGAEKSVTEIFVGEKEK